MENIKPYHLVKMHTYGDDWEEEECLLVRDEETAVHFLSEEYKNETLKVAGIEHFNAGVEWNVTLERVCACLTVSEIIEAVPELESVIHNALNNYSGTFPINIHDHT